MSKIKLLIADDEPDNLSLIKRKLGRKQYAYIEADNGEQVLRLLRDKENQDVKAIFMDISMPILDGYQTIAQIRHHQDFKEINKVLIIALTALAMKEDKEKILKAGADEYISKPIDDAFTQQIKSIFDRMKITC